LGGGRLNPARPQGVNAHFQQKRMHQQKEIKLVTQGKTYASSYTTHTHSVWMHGGTNRSRKWDPHHTLRIPIIHFLYSPPPLSTARMGQPPTCAHAAPVDAKRLLHLATAAAGRRQLQHQVACHDALARGAQQPAVPHAVTLGAHVAGRGAAAVAVDTTATPTTTAASCCHHWRRATGTAKLWRRASQPASRVLTQHRRSDRVKIRRQGCANTHRSEV
jgi:hypothetical protein